MRLFNFTPVLAVLGAFLVSSAFTASAFSSDVHSARTAALGGAGHAGPLLNDAIFLNPSFGSFLPTYSLGLNYLNYSGPAVQGQDPHGRNYTVSILDGRSDLFQAGAAYTQREDGTFIHVGASKTLIKRIGVSIGGKIFYNNPAIANGQDLDASVTGILSETMQTSITFDNILETKASRERHLTREIVVGTKYNLKSILLFYVDPHYAPTATTGKFGHEIGAELVVMNDFFLRIGNFRNANIPHLAARGRGYGLGFGWVGPRLSLDYGVQRVIEPVATTAHVFSFTAFF
ncbi:MAG: hypothetical protein H7222_16785 [Methylotenera sp.]|nr:hypothetical protein [Oligoflexia bacterium]